MSMFTGRLPNFETGPRIEDIYLHQLVQSEIGVKDQVTGRHALPSADKSEKVWTFNRQ